MKLRGWLERGAIVVAALATIATSRKGWVLEANKVPDDPDHARIIVVEATHEPHVEMYIGKNYENPRSLDPAATWPGKARYLIPAGAVVQRVLISDHCSGGACKKCEVPPDARIKIESITEVRTWKLETTSTPPVQPTNMNRDSWTTFRVEVDSSHPARLRVESTGPEGRVSSYGGEYHVDFGVVQVNTSFTWTVTAMIEEACLDPAQPCEPPATAHLAIKSIARESNNAP